MTLLEIKGAAAAIVTSAVILVATFIFGLAECIAIAKGIGTSEPHPVAEVWLSLVDAQKFAESWKDAAQYFRAAISQEQWQRSLQAVRKPLGSLVSRKLLSAKYARSLPGAPDGEYVVLQYQTSFANKKDAAERVTPMRDKDGQWRVSGYYIK
jgi:hypothetical protein